MQQAVRSSPMCQTRRGGPGLRTWSSRTTSCSTLTCLSWRLRATTGLSKRSSRESLKSSTINHQLSNYHKLIVNCFRKHLRMVRQVGLYWTGDRVSWSDKGHNYFLGRHREQCLISHHKEYRRLTILILVDPSSKSRRKSDNWLLSQWTSRRKQKKKFDSNWPKTMTMTTINSRAETRKKRSSNNDLHPPSILLTSYISTHIYQTSSNLITIKPQ